VPIIRNSINFKTNHIIPFFFTVAQQPPVGQGLLIVEVSQSHSDTSHTARLLWTSDQPDAESSI